MPVVRRRGSREEEEKEIVEQRRGAGLRTVLRARPNSPITYIDLEGLFTAKIGADFRMGKPGEGPTSAR